MVIVGPKNAVFCKHPVRKHITNALIIIFSSGFSNYFDGLL